jgi:hypothetical protein
MNRLSSYDQIQLQAASSEVALAASAVDTPNDLRVRVQRKCICPLIQVFMIENI